MPEPERMNLPAGYGDFEPFTIESAPDWDDFEGTLERSRNYWVAVTDEHGPHTVPVWGLWIDGVFIFSTDRLSRKGQALANGGVCVIHLESGDDVIIVHGRAERLPVPQYEMFVAAYDRKYGVLLDPEDRAQVLYRVVPFVAYSWLERDFQRTAVRWSF